MAFDDIIGWGVANDGETGQGGLLSQDGWGHARVFNEMQ